MTNTKSSSITLVLPEDVLDVLAHWASADAALMEPSGDGSDRQQLRAQRADLADEFVRNVVKLLPTLLAESELADAIARLCQPYPQMRIVEGWRLVPHVPAFFLDGLHPNDLGMTWMANGVLQALADMMR